MAQWQVLHLQRKYNRDFPAIYNTYQCYLKASKQTLRSDMIRDNSQLPLCLSGHALAASGGFGACQA
jgi:hypothetical protein